MRKKTKDALEGAPLPQKRILSLEVINISREEKKTQKRKNAKESPLNIKRNKRKNIDVKSAIIHSETERLRNSEAQVFLFNEEQLLEAGQSDLENKEKREAEGELNMVSIKSNMYRSKLTITAILLVFKRNFEFKMHLKGSWNSLSPVALWLCCLVG